MNRDEAKRYVKDQLENYLQSKGINTSKNFKCLNPAHDDKHPSMSLHSDKNGVKHCKCFSCGAYYDILDIIGIDYNLTEQKDQFQKAYDIFGIQIDGKGNANLISPIKRTADRTLPPAPKEEIQISYKDFFNKAHSNIDNTDYWSKRGLSREIVDRFNIGYVDNWKHPKTENDDRIKPTPRLIIPTSEYSYTARDVRDDNELAETEKGFKKMKCGNAHIFNGECLDDPTQKTPIFVVEGEIDAMSIISAGGAAVGIGSANNKNNFIDCCKAHKPKQPLFILFDKEDDEEKAKRISKLAADLKSNLKELEIDSLIIPSLKFFGDYHDANDMLVKNRKQLERQIQAVYMKYQEKREEQYNKETRFSNDIDSFFAEIMSGESLKCCPTHFPRLDKALNGGLYEGLYLIGAISSLGKTAFTMQIADQIAQNGTDVLIFSLEMAKSELMARSISRMSAVITLSKNNTYDKAQTLVNVMRYSTLLKEEKELVKSAIGQYKTYVANNLYGCEGVGNMGVKEIREKVKEHITYTGRTPIVIVDYLQILAPMEPKATDKQNMDRAVVELKRISRDYKTPVIAISSLNRDNYTRKVSMRSFKESGAIEYSSDVLIGLQFRNVGNDGFDLDKEIAKLPRELELVVLKNRKGKAGDSIPYDFYSPFSLFIEGKEDKKNLHRENGGEDKWQRRY